MNGSYSIEARLSSKAMCVTLNNIVFVKKMIYYYFLWLTSQGCMLSLETPISAGTDITIWVEAPAASLPTVPTNSILLLPSGISAYIAVAGPTLLQLGSLQHGS